MTTQSAMEPQDQADRAVGLLVAVLAAFAGIFGFAGHDTANAVVTFRSQPSSQPTCASYTYCLEFDSAMNGRAIDSIWWGHTTQQEAVTTKFDKLDYYLHNHLWGVYFPDNTYKDQGSFELRSIGQPGWCLKEPTDRSQLAVSPCNDVPGHEVDPRQVWYLAPTDNADRFSLRSTWDGKCADILERQQLRRRMGGSMELRRCRRQYQSAMDDLRLVGNTGFHDPRRGHRPQVRHANGDHTGPPEQGRNGALCTRVELARDDQVL